MGHQLKFGIKRLSEADAEKYKVGTLSCCSIDCNSGVNSQSNEMDSFTAFDSSSPYLLRLYKIMRLTGRKGAYFDRGDTYNSNQL